MTIRFGTSGWRGVLADDFGFAGVRAVSAAVARWALESGSRPRVVVAHDTRFLGERFASVASRVLECDDSDGVHITLEDGFLMFRASGTEPVLRIYAEARGPRLLSRRLRSGARLLARVAGRESGQ